MADPGQEAYSRILAFFEKHLGPTTQVTAAQN
jgi:hypothetical protein